MPLGSSDTGWIIPAPRLLGRFSHFGMSFLPHPPLPCCLVDQRAFNGTKAVHVFDFDDWCFGNASVGLWNVEIDIGIHPQAALLHVAITDAQIDQQ